MDLSLFCSIIEPWFAIVLTFVMFCFFVIHASPTDHQMPCHTLRKKIHQKSHLLYVFVLTLAFLFCDIVIWIVSYNVCLVFIVVILVFFTFLIGYLFRMMFRAGKRLVLYCCHVSSDDDENRLITTTTTYQSINS